MALKNIMRQILFFLSFLLCVITMSAQSITFTPHKFSISDLKYAYFSQEEAVFATISVSESGNSGSINILDSNFNIFHSFQIFASMFGNGTLDYLDVEGAEPAMAYGVLVTQYLFNDDDLFEFIVRKENNEYEIYNEKAEYLGICPDREIVIIRDVPYFQVKDPNDSSYFTLYTINKEDSNGSSGIVGNQAILSIYGNQSYVLDSFYPEASCAKIEIKPQEKWEIYSVVFNDEDVTDSLQENVLITPPLTGENSLEILMIESASISTLVANSNNRISITREENGISVGNIDPSEKIKIYDINGTLIYDGREKFIPLNKKGMYILKSEKGAIKFAF